jgi:hypothetical protein
MTDKPVNKTTYCSYVERRVENVEYQFNGRTNRRVGCEGKSCTDCKARQIKLACVKESQERRRRDGKV